MPHIVPACMDVNYYNTLQKIYASVICGLAEEYSKSIFVCLPRLLTILYQNLGGCILESLDHRLTKYIYNILHGDNNVIKTIVHSKLNMFPKSIIAENYKYISYKYRLTLTGQRVSVMSLTKIAVPPDPKTYCLM